MLSGKIVLLFLSATLAASQAQSATLSHVAPECNTTACTIDKNCRCSSDSSPLGDLTNYPEVETTREESLCRANSPPHGVGIDGHPSKRYNALTYNATGYPKSCLEILKSGNTQSGIYVIQPELSKKPFEVICDMDLDDGGWTHIQKRVDGRIDFYRGWRDYRFGFGYLDEDLEFWMGLENIYVLTASQLNELLVEIVDRKGDTTYAKYTIFVIGREEDAYPLKALGNYSGDAGDALSYHLGMKFSTFDLDQDKHSTTNCAEYHKGAWWYNACYYSNLNGKYINLDVDIGRGIMAWYKQDYCLAKARMLIRPASF